MKLSIIIPAHNEEDNIASVIEKIEGVISGIDYELVVVNDHSSDRTGAIIAEASRKYDNIRLAVNNMDRGFANALRAGFRSSSGDVVISVMADLCDDLATIRAMWDKVGAGYDVVCGCRYIKGGKRVGGSKIKGFFSSFVGHSLHLLLGIPTHDVANAFKMYRRNVIEAMKTTSRSFEISMELALKAYYLGFKVTEVPTAWKERTKGKSTFKMLRLLPNYLGLYLGAISFRLKDKQLWAVILLGAVFISALALRVYQLSFFEFKGDQLLGILYGNSTREAHFLITHGLVSGVGVNNPAFFLWFMGVVTFFTNSPFWITLVFMFSNAIALALAMAYFYRSLPRTYAVLACLFLVSSPAFTVYCSNIWPQCLLPLLMILFHITIYRLISADDGARYFIFLVILAILAAQLHLSGLFLFPLLVILGIFYRRRIGLKISIAAMLLTLIAFLPYLYHLFFEREWGRLSFYGQFWNRSIYWKVFREHLRVASFDFFRYYLKEDFNAVLASSVGISRFILYPLSCVLMALFAVSLVYYLVWLIRGRRLFNASPQAIDKCPLPFQISGFIAIFVTLGYFVFRVRTPPHYFIVLFPCYSLLTGFMAYRLWRTALGRAIVLLSLISTAILLTATFLFLDKAGGHPYEYGPSYRTLLDWQKDLRGLIPAGHCGDLRIQCPQTGKCDRNAISFVVSGNDKCPESQAIPVRLSINWDARLMRYQHSWEVGESDTKDK